MPHGVGEDRVPHVGGETGLRLVDVPRETFVVDVHLTEAGVHLVAALVVVAGDALAVSLGGVDSLAVHTAAMWSGTMNEAQMKAAGIPPNFVRFSVGIEHIEDLKSDVDRALREAA